MGTHCILYTKTPNNTAQHEKGLQLLILLFTTYTYCMQRINKTALGDFSVDPDFLIQVG